MNPNITSELNKVYYVALSRTMEKLFISIPSMVDKIEKNLTLIGFEIVKCANTQLA